MKIEYYILNPTGNITALVYSAVSENSRKEAAAAVMKAEPSVEQVGFIDFSDGAFLNMAGGEFCGNATMSAGALYYEMNSLTGEKSVPVKVSCIDGKINTLVKKENEEYICSVEMPEIKSIYEREFLLDGKKYILPVVELCGISHIILEEKADKAFCERAIVKWCSELGSDGLGIMQYDSKNNSMIPLVYVPGADTLFWESSCASGTTALGAYLSYKTGEDVCVSVSEPAGKLKVESEKGSSEVKLTGRVKIQNKREIEL